MKYTVILPIHMLDESNSALIEKALQSLTPFKEKVVLLTVAPPDVEFEANEFITHRHIVNTGATDFCSQVNLGIDGVMTEWFSILEYDDSYSPKWFFNTDKYIAAYPDVDVFLPVVADIDEGGKFLSFTNETLWALGFSNTQGELDNAVLLEYQNFQISGAIYKTEKIKKFGKLKSNIKLSFGYEFLLRLTHNGTKIMAIPKIGYKHTNMRKDSLFWNYKHDEKQKLSSDEGKFWMDIARKEFFFTEQRDVAYSE
jgi:hypothetical protein